MGEKEHWESIEKCEDMNLIASLLAEAITEITGGFSYTASKRLNEAKGLMDKYEGIKMKEDLKVTIEEGMEIVLADEDNKEIASGYVDEIGKDEKGDFVFLSNSDYIWIKPKNEQSKNNHHYIFKM